MSYDIWISRVPDTYDEHQDEEPCRSCGALPDEPCIFTCECEACDRQRERREAEQKDVA